MVRIVVPSRSTPPTRARRVAGAICAALLVAAGFLLPTGAATAVGETTFTNPLLADGADPWLQYYDGNYYLATTTWNSQLVIRKSPTLAGLSSAAPVYVWSDTNPDRCCNFWAPEFHRLTGPNGTRWYLIYCPGPPASAEALDQTLSQRYRRELHDAPTDQYVLRSPDMRCGQNDGYDSTVRSIIVARCRVSPSCFA